MGVSFARGLESLRLNTESLGERYNEVIDERIDEVAVVGGAAYMKEHAPWNDSTGNRKDRVPGAARAGLNAEETSSGLEFSHSHKEITFSHSEEYGIFLETKNNGKDQIIMPSVKAVGEKLMASLTGSLNEAARKA